MRWFIPSWNGDFRLERVSDKSCRLVMIEPTPAELDMLDHLGKRLLANKLVTGKELPLWTASDKSKEQEVKFNHPFADIAKQMVKTVAPDAQTLTVAKNKNGKTIAVDGAGKDLALLLEGNDTEKAATVKRPTMCCPQAHVPVSPSTPAEEVLLEFLDEAQRDQWATDRSFIAEGHLSGRRYLIAHRESITAAKIGKCCYDLDAEAVVHAHATQLPPEEEVLSMKFMIEHREPWVINEASMLGAQQYAFKNPFGGSLDGMDDTCFVSGIGGGAIALLEMLSGQPLHPTMSIFNPKTYQLMQALALRNPQFRGMFNEVFGSDPAELFQNQ